jgi:hypothetical protein
MIELIIAKTAQELKDKFDEFKNNSFIAPLPYSYSGGRAKVIEKAETTSSGSEFVMFVDYYWRKLPA